MYADAMAMQHTLCNIAPPNLKQIEAAYRVWEKLNPIKYSQNLPVHDIIKDPPPPTNRLKSRK